MNRHALEHLLWAAAAITGEPAYSVVGSAATLPSTPAGVPVSDLVVRSREADLMPVSGSAQLIDLIDGALGLTAL